MVKRKEDGVREDRYDRALREIAREMQIPLDTDRTKVKHGFQRLGKYIKGSLLGRGGFAEVFQFRDAATGKVYAGKQLPTHANARSYEKIQMERKIFKMADHPNVLKMVDSFEDRRNAYLVFELCDYQTLKDYQLLRGRLHEPEVKYFFGQIVDGLRYLHGKGIIHRDIKLNNILLTK